MIKLDEVFDLSATNIARIRREFQVWSIVTACMTLLLALWWSGCQLIIGSVPSSRGESRWMDLLIPVTWNLPGFVWYLATRWAQRSDLRQLLETAWVLSGVYGIGWGIANGLLSMAGVCGCCFLFALGRSLWRWIQNERYRARHFFSFDRRPIPDADNE